MTDLTARTAGPAGRADDALKRRLHETMVRIRVFEDAMSGLALNGAIRGLYYSQKGQEAVAAGLGAAMQPQDYLVTTYRGNGDQIAKGARMDRMVAEIMGREGGYCRGKGGVMHICSFEIGVLGATGIVGGGLPIAAGAALSSQVLGTGQVTFCSFGDGAANQGTFHESLNVASLWKLPVVFVCQNNGYAEATAVRLHLSVPHVADRASAYGMPGQTVDGKDPLAVYDAIAAAAERARAGEGPSLIECLAPRYAGHFIGDQMVYISPEERAEWARTDPVETFEQSLLQEGVLTKEDVARVWDAARREVEDAIAFAQSSPEPSPGALLTDVYADGASHA